MKRALWKVAKWVFYPLFYLFCLVFFAYITFPYSKLKERLLADFARKEAVSARRPGSAGPMRLEVGELTGYWLTGVELNDVRLHIPRKPKGAKRGAAPAAETPEEPAESVVKVDHATLRARMLPLLTGKVRIDFDVSAFNGRLTGTVPYSGSGGELLAELSNVDLAEIAPLRALIPLPLLGTLRGKVALVPGEGKFSKADGSAELKFDDVIIGDGDAKVEGIALPPARIGSISLTGTAKEGVLTIEEISAQGGDVEIAGEGTIRLREPWNRSRIDLALRFRFSDAYRDKDDTTRSLLGKPGDKFPPAIEVGSPEMKKAKRDDGFYAFRIFGALDDPRVEAQGTGAAKPTKPGTPTRRGRPSATGNDDEPSPSPAGATTGNKPSLTSKLPRPSFGNRARAAAGGPEGRPTQPPPEEPALTPPPEELAPPPPPPPAEPEEQPAQPDGTTGEGAAPQPDTTPDTAGPAPPSE